MNNSNIIVAEGLHKTYHLGQTAIEVLRGLSVSVRRGEFLAIVGASGSGKSTLLHILGSLDKPDSGRVLFENTDIASLSGRKMNEYRNRQVGFVFQFYHLLDELTVLENVLLPVMADAGAAKWLRVRKNANERARELLEQLGMEKRAGHRPYQLSGGERQRTAIARALINNPPLLLADEPTGNLDSATGFGILNVFKQLNEAGQTIVMVTHDERIASGANRVIKLADGTVVACGS